MGKSFSCLFPAELTPLERRQKKVKEAAEFNSISEDTFRRKYSHVIKRIGKGAQGVELGDPIDLSPSPQGS